MFYQVFMSSELGSVTIDGINVISPEDFFYDGMVLMSKSSTLTVEHRNAGYSYSDSIYAEASDKVIVTLWLESGRYPRVSLKRLRAGEHNAAEAMQQVNLARAYIEARNAKHDAEQAARQNRRANTPEAIAARKKLEKIDARIKENPNWKNEIAKKAVARARISTVLLTLCLPLFVLGIILLAGAPLGLEFLAPFAPFVVAGIALLMFLLLPHVYITLLGAAENWVAIEEKGLLGRILEGYKVGFFRLVHFCVLAIPFAPFIAIAAFTIDVTKKKESIDSKIDDLRMEAKGIN